MLSQAHWHWSRVAGIAVTLAFCLTAAPGGRGQPEDKKEEKGNDVRGKAPEPKGEGPAEGKDDDNRERADNPGRAAAFHQLLVAGGKDKNVPAEAMPKAIQQVRKLRSAAAKNFGLKPAAMAGLALAGTPRTVAGVPVGELPGGPAPAGGNADEAVPAATPLAAAAGINPAGWRWIGPGNIGGRTRSLLIHPASPNIMYLGGVAGGVWKTTNAGVTWAPLYDFMASIAVSCMALDPNNPDVVYAGTGEGFFNLDAVRGFGIFKSTNGGATWTQLAATAGADADKFRYVNRLALASNGPKATVLLAATQAGLFRSTDGGATFSAVKGLAGVDVLDVKFHPADAKKCVAGTRGGRAFVSSDGGVSWQKANGISAVASAFRGRVELTYARANGNVVYASVDDGLGKVYRSVDGGQTYTLRGSPGHLAGQGWYANCLWAGDPTNPNLLVVGGLDLHRSINGGTSFTKISTWQLSPQSAHADHHVIVGHPGYNGTTNKAVLFGNDGGVYRADDVTTVQGTTGWKELNNGLGITQFYGAAANLQTGKVVGGAQDNGTLLYDPPSGTENWKEIFGGDGGDCAADPVQQYYYGEYVYLQIHRSFSGGPSAYIFQGIAEAGSGSTALFIAPFVLDPNNSSTMLAGALSLWRSKNVKQTPPTWQAIKPAGAARISAVTVAKGDSKNLWVGYEDGAVARTSNGTSASPTWKAVGAGLPDRYVSRIVIDPAAAKTVYVTNTGYQKGNLSKSTDAGGSWTTLGGGVLPEVPFYDLAIHPQNSKLLYLGTDVGLFVSEDAGATWYPTNQGPTNAPAYRLFWVNTTLYAATHGRGIFRIDLAAPTAAPPAQEAVAP